MSGCNSMIVGVVGTSNVGKTTFINDVVSESSQMDDAMDRWTVWGDDYRKVIAERGLNVNREGNEETQTTIHGILKRNVLSAVGDGAPRRILMDRTVLDSFVYTYWHYLYGSAPISIDTLAAMWQDVLRCSHVFDAIIYMPLKMCGDIAVVEDGVRDTDTAYRTQIDAIMGYAVHRLWKDGVRVTTMHGSREERLVQFHEMERMLSDCGTEAFLGFHEAIERQRKSERGE